MCQLGSEQRDLIDRLLSQYRNDVEKNDLQTGSDWSHLTGANSFVRWIYEDFEPVTLHRPAGGVAEAYPLLLVDAASGDCVFLAGWGRLGLAMRVCAVLEMVPSKSIDTSLMACPSSAVPFSLRHSQSAGTEFGPKVHGLIARIDQGK